MKKVIAIILALMLIFLCGCGNNPDDNSSIPSKTQTTEFVKPQNYVTVLQISINPKFNLYLDINNKVLAVEPINTDAQGVIEKVTIKTGTLDTVINDIVVATNESGFTKQEEKVTVNFEITEIKNTDVKTDDILKAAKTSATTSFNEIKIETEIKTKVSENAVVDNKDDVSSLVSSSAPVSSKPASSKPSTSTSKPVVSNYTPILQKGGSWIAGIVNGTSYYDIVMVLTSQDKFVDMEVGDNLSTFPEDIRENVKPDCELRNGEYYYFARGDGGEITSVTENGTTITLIDENGGKTEFTRIDENKIKLKSATTNSICFDDIKIGSVLTFTTEN